MCCRHDGLWCTLSCPNTFGQADLKECLDKRISPGKWRTHSLWKNYHSKNNLLVQMIKCSDNWALDNRGSTLPQNETGTAFVDFQIAIFLRSSYVSLVKLNWMKSLKFHPLHHGDCFEGVWIPASITPYHPTCLVFKTNHYLYNWASIIKCDGINYQLKQCWWFPAQC